MTALSTLRAQFAVTADVPSWDDLLDGAARLYWRRRPDAPAPCGSHPGYLGHIAVGEPTCSPCREAHNLVEQIRVVRAARHVATVTPLPVRPGGDLCASAHVRLWEPLCAWCLVRLGRRRTEVAA